MNRVILIIHQLKKYRSQRINAVIPIQYNGINIGAVFVENIDIRSFDSIKVRNALDKFGLQFGLWVTKKLIEGGISKTLELPPYKPGSYVVEECSWLDIWSHGHQGNKENQLVILVLIWVTIIIWLLL